MNALSLSLSLVTTSKRIEDAPGNGQYALTVEGYALTIDGYVLTYA
jgi:hypothetical protein